MRRPELIVIFVPGDGNIHVIGGHYKSGKWTYSKLVIMPEADLNPFVAERREAGMTYFDVRIWADLHTPGMSKATPVLLFKAGFNMDIAMQGYTKLHRAILESEVSE